MPEPVAQRVVPGAPPPPPLSKTQKKRRKAKAKSDSPEDNHVVPDVTVAALVEKAPESAELQQGALAPELVAHDSRAPSILEEDSLLKNSPIVELVTKRFKATNKKITRITGYAAMDADKLNDDQKRTLKTLPTLEAVQKELGEVKKAIEVHEAELAHELAAKRAEVEKAEKARIQAAVTAAQSTILSKTGDILNLLRFRSSLANGEIDTSALSMQGVEATAIYAASDALLGEDGDRKQAVISGFLLSDGEGHLDGVPYSRLIEITTAALNPPREPTPEPEEEQEPAVTTNTTDEVPSTASITGPSESEVPVNITAGVPGPVAASNSFRFMQDSELEGPFDETPADVPQEIFNPQEHAPVDEPEPEQAPVNGHTDQGSVPVAADAPGTIDWAAEENAELPSIAGLHAEFGTSGSATPADTQPAQQQEQEQPTAVDGEAAAPPTPSQARADDGFQPAGGRGHHRGRGGLRGGPDDRRGRGGFRGGYRGHGERGGGPGGERGFRGGYRGGDRGGRGGFRGRGEYRGEGRGGYRGDGEYRGEGRGGYRGDGEHRGEGRGGYRGDGERRGGGRGRGRGDYRGGPPREGAPSGAVAAAAAPASPAPAAA